MKISLGPIPFLWEKNRIVSFYKEIADTSVSVVYVGEVVCSKRAILGIDMLKTICNMLKDAGKEVVISTFGLMTNQEELEFAKTLCTIAAPIEVNNIGILNFCEGKETIAGPHLAIYNGSTAGYFASIGVKRIVFMPELSSDAIRSVSSAVPGVEKEIIAFGNLPLAFSWRCYTARALGMSKANCAISCIKYPEGMPLETMDRMPVFNINGTQIVSAQKVCMIEEIDLLSDMGIGLLRIMPHPASTIEIIDIFSSVTEGARSPSDAVNEIRRFAPEGISNGWFYGQPGWEYVGKESAEAYARQASQSHIQDNY